MRYRNEVRLSYGDYITLRNLMDDVAGGEDGLTESEKSTRAQLERVIATVEHIRAGIKARKRRKT